MNIDCETPAPLYAGPPFIGSLARDSVSLCVFSARERENESLGHFSYRLLHVLGFDQNKIFFLSFY